MHLILISYNFNNSEPPFKVSQKEPIKKKKKKVILCLHY